MTAKLLAVDMQDRAAEIGVRSQFRDDIGIFAVGDKADVLAVLLVGHDESHFRGKRTDFGLGQVAERKAQIVQLVLCGGKQEIGLVPLGIDRTIERPMGAIGAAGDVMAGGEAIGVQIARGGQQIGKLHRLVAGDARHRCLASQIALHERIDDRVAESAFIIQDVMRDAKRFAHAARVVDVLTGATGPGAPSGFPAVIELERDADDIIAFAGQDAGHDRGIHAARHGNDHTGVFRRFGDVQRIELHGPIRSVARLTVASLAKTGVKGKLWRSPSFFLPI